MPEPTVGELVEQYEHGSDAKREVIREMLIDAENGIFWASVISATELRGT